MSDSSKESPQPTSSGTRPIFTLSSPFYPGGTGFGGSAGSIRVSDHFSFGRTLASEVNKSGEMATYSEATESKTLKRRRLYAYLKHKDIMYRNYRKILNNLRLDPIQELHETPMSSKKNSFTKPVVRTFYFSEPIPLKPLGSKRNYVFSDPTPLD